MLSLTDPLLLFIFYRLQDWRLQGPSSVDPTAATNCSAAGAATGSGLVGQEKLVVPCMS